MFKLDDKKLQQKLKSLPPNLAKKALRKACRAGAKIFASQLKQDVRIDTGTLRKQVKVRAGKSKKLSLSVNASTGDPKKANLNSGEAFYGSFVEYGTKNMSAQPFIRPAFDKVKQKAYDATIKILGDELDKEATK